MWLTRYELTNIVQKSKSQKVHCNFKSLTGSIQMIKLEASNHMISSYDTDKNVAGRM
jgi:hypothetical protein